MGLPFLDLSFYFDWNDPSLPTPVPITAQCETIKVKWGRGAATGPDPKAPYWFTIYTSLYQAPILLPAGDKLSANLTIPFPPNTLYQICMYDSVGNTGGCQDVYTVYKPSPDFQPTCSNWTEPEALKIKSSAGRYGWIPQCHPITLTLEDGTAPYRFSAQPALHPPMNVTGITGSTFEWRNILGWTVPFFISLVDANGKSWSYGPLHSGDGPSSCLDYDPSKKVTMASAAVVAGSAIGLVFGGAILALIAVYLFYKWRVRRYGKLTYAQPVAFYTEDQTTQNIPSGTGGRLKPGHQGHNSNLSHGYITSPYDPSVTTEEMREQGRRTSADPQSDPGSRSDANRPAGQNVYVVHHDAGRAPVTIYGADGTQIVELPPNYGDGPDSVPTPPSASSTRPVPNNPQNIGRALPPTAMPDRKRPDLVTSRSSPVRPSGSTSPGPSYPPGAASPVTPGARMLPPLPPTAGQSNDNSAAGGSGSGPSDNKSDTRWERFGYGPS